MDVRPIQPEDYAAAFRLLAECGWAHRLGTLAEFVRLIEASQRVVVAVSAAGEVVGFARGITDGCSNGYLSMVAVAPTQRRQGVGRALVSAVTGADEGVTWVLRAGRDGAAEFFASLGFTHSTEAMERKRTAHRQGH